MELIRVFSGSIASALILFLGGVSTAWGVPVPVAHYTFDDGTASDSSGNNLHGALVGNAQIVNNETRPMAPGGNKVLSLDGVAAGPAGSSYVDLGTSPLLDFSGSNATVAAWIFVNVSKSHNTIFSQGEWRRGASLTLKGDTVPPDQLWTGRTGPDQSFLSSDPIPVQQWTHVAATWRVVGTNTEVMYYINGISNNTFAMTSTLLSPVNGSAIGREWRSSDPSHVRWVFNGFIDDMRLYNTALEPAEIFALHAGQEAPPQILVLSPAEGTGGHPVGDGIHFAVNTVSPNTIDPSDIQFFLNGVDLSSALTVGGDPTNRSASYSATLVLNEVYTAHVIATDSEGRVSTRTWTFDTVDPSGVPGGTALNVAALGAVRQTGGDAAPGVALLAVDGSLATFSQTVEATNAFWEMELHRPYPITRIEIIPPPGTEYNSVLSGLVVRVSDLRDRTLFASAITNSGAWSMNFPAPVNGRIIRIGLEGGQPNGKGDHRVVLAEVRLFGDPSPLVGPMQLGAVATVSQSSTNGANGPVRAIDRNVTTFSETLNQTNSWWLLTFDRTRPIDQVELVNRASASNASRMEGLILRILDDASNSVASATVPNPGPGNNWIFTPPPGTTGRYIRIGLEDGATNGQGNRVVSVAEVNVLSAANLAAGADSYMTRSHDGLNPVSFVNDGSFSTQVNTHASTVDSYFEVDLGEPRALYTVRAVAADNMQFNITRATASLFDAEHKLVYAQHLGGNPTEIFDVDLPGAVVAKYVRIGLENKERTSPTGGTSWQIGLKELQAFGRDASDVGILSFTVAETNIASGGSTALQWQEADLFELRLHPHIGSVGAFTAPGGEGSLIVGPAESTHYTLVGSNYSGRFTREVTVEVNGQKLPPRISEFVAGNQLSLRDGYNDSSDWIELHNPNNTPLDLTGYFLSDNPSSPQKWAFPSGVVMPPHGYVIVFASGRTVPFDPAGYLHADFSLAVDGESVLLSGPGGVVDSIVGYPPQRDDLAYGRTLDGNWAFLEPTPGGANVAVSYEGWLQPVVFSHTRGFYTNGFTLTLSNPNPDSEVFYSLDGTEPSLLYTEGLAISELTGVRAAVKRDGFKSPRTQTHSYVFIDSVVSSLPNNTIKAAHPDRLIQGLLELPTFVVNVPPAGPAHNAERVEREASVEIFLQDGTAPLQVNCGITHYGGSFGSTNNANSNPYIKRSYQLKFRAEYGARKLEAPLFRGFDLGFPVRNVFDEIDLHAGNHDMISRGFHLSHRFAADTMLEMGSLNPHGRFVHLYVNGEYRGLFSAHERLTASFLSEYLGGSKEDYLTVKGNDNAPGGNFILGVPDPDPPGRAPWEEMRANRNSYEAVKDALDVPNLIDFMIVWNWGDAEAEYRSAGARVGGPGRGFKFWLADADGHLRPQSGATGQLNKNQLGNSGPGLLFGALMTESHPDFRALLADRIYRHFFDGGAMTPEASVIRMDRRVMEISNAIVAECARWNPPVGRTPENWESDVNFARTNILQARSGILLNNMRIAGWYPSFDPPGLSQAGGSVTNGFPLTFTTEIETVYYTLDGSDPRLPGGGISPSAIAWDGNPVFLHSNTIVKARVLNDGQWSALTEASFQVAHALAQAPYILNGWNASEPAGTYPPHMAFYQTSTIDPGLSAEMDSLWTLPYDLTSRSRINGLGTNGFAFINTDNPQAVEGAGFVGAAVLALNTLGTDQIRVTWTGGTVTPNTRVYGIRLQYRVGNDGPFEDVVDSFNNPVQYLRNPQAGHSVTIGPALLPEAANDQPYVEVRWKYYYVSGASGARAQLRVDDIRMTSGATTAQQLAFVAHPLSAQTGRVLPAITVRAQTTNDVLDTEFNGMISVASDAGPGALNGTLTRQATGGVAVFNDLTFAAFGPQTLIASADGLNSGVSGEIAVVALTEVLMPLYIQGEQPDNDNRVPFACRVTLEGLKTNAVYRYANRWVLSSDPETQNGAGNALFVRTNGASFIRTTETPRFLDADLNLRHAEFMTDANGSFTGWFVSEPSGNARFTPGSTLFLRLLLNDGADGETEFHYLTAPGAVQVMSFGGGGSQGSGVYAVSSAAPRNFAVLYPDAAGVTRPLAATVVEGTGAAVDERYASFYEALVGGFDGRWGTIVPNGLVAGVQRIEERDLVTGGVVSVFVSPQGHHPTTGLNSGTAAVGINVPGSGDSAFAKWQSQFFTLAELGDPEIGGPFADPADDGIANLFKFATGLHPFESGLSGLPTARRVDVEGSPWIEFRHRRLIGDHGITYTVQLSEDLTEWLDDAGELILSDVEPAGDGMTEIVTLLLPVEPAPTQRFLRLRVSVP